MSVLSLCFLCEKNSLSSKLFSDPICPFSSCWVKDKQEGVGIRVKEVLRREIQGLKV
jgi:hypothetical protein